MSAFDKAWNSITKAEMSCPFCGEPFDIYDIRDFDDSPGIEAFRKYGCGAFKTPQKECKSDSINKAWAIVKNENEVPIDECKGCGLAHGSPNSEYCSEICERQNKVEKSEYKGENQPTNPSLWSQAKSKARSKFKVYPSAYANGWAAKWYKSKGGGWKKKGKAEKK